MGFGLMQLPLNVCEKRVLFMNLRDIVKMMDININYTLCFVSQRRLFKKTLSCSDKQIRKYFEFPIPPEINLMFITNWVVTLFQQLL